MENQTKTDKQSPTKTQQTHILLLVQEFLPYLPPEKGRPRLPILGFCTSAVK